jgi:hypothetical protein
MPSEGVAFDHRDVAVLAVSSKLPDDVTPLPRHVGDPTGPVQMWGPAPGRLSDHVTGELLGLADSCRWQVRQLADGAGRVVQRFSGGPAWRPSSGTVVGMVQAAGTADDATDTYLLGTDLIATAVPGWMASGAPTVPPGLSDDLLAPDFAYLIGARVREFVGSQWFVDAVRSHLADRAFPSQGSCVVAEGVADLGLCGGPGWCEAGTTHR